MFATTQSLVLVSILVTFSSIISIEAFHVNNFRINTRLHAQSSTNDNERRKVLSRGAGAALSILLGGTALEQPAVASYSAYTRREQDWQERSEKGGEFVKILKLRKYWIVYCLFDFHILFCAYLMYILLVYDTMIQYSLIFSLFFSTISLLNSTHNY